MQNSTRRLPLMQTIEEAAALSQKENDAFYLTAFVIQGWLGQLVAHAAAEYAEKKQAKQRSLQTGRAWQGFLELFHHATDTEYPGILSALFRFAEYSDPMARLLRRALIPLSVEHDSSGDYFGPKSMPTAKRPEEGVELARRSITRWCDWLDALIHFHTHRLWHLAPAPFDPDPDKRELGVLGANQLHLARLDDSARARWQRHFFDAAARFGDSPKWPTLGKAMSTDSDRLWPYRQVDTAIISLWPLVKAHNWTYRDLLNTIRPALARPDAYPCDREQDLAAYCPNVLGLRKTGKGVTAKHGPPAGYAVARQLFPVSDT